VSRRAGFSLIEALVALAVASGALVLLLGLGQRLAQDQARHEAELCGAQTRLNALVLLADLNPMARPNGVLALPPRGAVAWTARPLTPARRNTLAVPGDGDFEVRLYRVEVRATDATGAGQPPFTVDRMGWRRLRAAR